MVKIKSGFSGERAVILPKAIIDGISTDDFCYQLYITDIGYYPYANNHFRRRSEVEAQQYILLYCTEGDGWFELQGAKTKVTANQLFILQKNKAHSYGCSANKTWTIYWIHFDGQLAAFFANGFEKPVPIEPGAASRINDRLKLFEEIFQTLKNGFSKQNLEFCSTALIYFLGSLKFVSSYRSATVSMVTTIDKEVVEGAIHFMRENLHKKLTVNSIAKYVGLSASHFSAIFQAKTGFSPIAYFSHLKIQEACHYLDFTTMKINQISAKTGYNDALYFSRIFTKTMGMSPAAYRKLKKG